MTEQQNGGVGRMSRRDAIARVAGAGLGIASILRADLRVASAQGGTPPALPSALNASFPKAPLWDTELKKLAPTSLPTSRPEARVGATAVASVTPAPSWDPIA